ncbi:MAG: hypothetical protein HYV16_00970 [Gammaproteobacteria bacterium]|nr:hypothetical protein [Gammaproteobacteria bacterium]
MKRPALWIGLFCLAAALGLLLLGRERREALLVLQPKPQPTAKPASTAAPPAKTEDKSKPPPSPAPAAQTPVPAADSDFQRWHRGDLLGMCGEFPVGGEVYALLARQQYLEAMRLATDKAQHGDVPAMGLLDAYRGLCAAFMQGEALQDFQQREAYLLQGESPEAAEQIRAYLQEERGTQERLAQACPEIVSTSDAAASQFSTLLHERAEDASLPAGHRRILARLLDQQEPGFARQQMDLAARQGDGTASFELAMLISDTTGSDGGKRQTQVQALTQALRQGSVEARVELAYCWLHGCTGTPRNTELALIHLRGAARLGHPGAMMSLISLLRDGNDQFKPHPSEAMSWILHGEHLAASGAFNSASLEMRQEFKSLKQELMPSLSYAEQEHALSQAKLHTAQSRPIKAPPKECASLSPATPLK